MTLQFFTRARLITVDHRKGWAQLMILCYPDLRPRFSSRQFTQSSMCVFVEKTYLNPGRIQELSNEVSLGQWRRGVHPAHATKTGRSGTVLV
jgi:hypothetical protein